MNDVDNDTPKRHYLPLLPRLGLEIASLAIGVALALSVNQWNENRKNENAAEEALSYVASELAVNLKIIRKVNEINIKLLTFLENLPPSVDSDSNETFSPGIQIRDSAWKALNASGASSHIDYQTLIPLAEIYSFQDIYKAYGFRIVEGHINASLITAASGSAIDQTKMTQELLPNIRLMVSIEKHLIELYQASIEQLEKIGN